MKVKVFPADEGACGFYRVIAPTRALQLKGYDVEFGGPSDIQGHYYERSGGQGIGGCEPIDADVVVLQRPLKGELVDVIPYLQAQGVAVVVEVDDDFKHIPASNPGFMHWHPRTNPEKNTAHLARAMKLADMVTVSTPALATIYGGHGRVEILPNYIPAWYLDVAPLVDGEVIGWTGTPMTHGEDLAVVGSAVSEVCRMTGAKFRAIGSERTLELLGVKGESVPWMPLEDYPHEVAQLGIGIVPLADNAFNRAKSWLKGLEYAALGVPFVFSPLTEYLRLAVGLPASKPREWKTMLGHLVQSAAHREDLSIVGRKVASHLTIEEHCEKWWDAWGLAAEHRLSRTIKEFA